MTLIKFRHIKISKEGNDIRIKEIEYTLFIHPILYKEKMSFIFREKLNYNIYIDLK